MKWILLVSAGFLGISACEKRKEVAASGARPVTLRDADLKLDASEDERFGVRAAPAPTPMYAGPSSSPLVPTLVPEGWRELPEAPMRLLNYGFGADGEVYVSLSRGGLLENVNRWRRQFGEEPLDPSGIDDLEKVTLPGFTGVWVEMEGTYAAGMGKAPLDGRALAGLVATDGTEIFTVKMVGGTAEVAAEKERLRAFVRSLEPAK